MTISEGAALSPNTANGVDFPLAVAIRFAVAVVVWGGLGAAIDRVVPAAPWMGFAGVLLGVLIGLVLVQRRAERPDGEVTAPPVPHAAPGSRAGAGHE